VRNVADTRTLAELESLVGSELGVSDWVTVDQALVDGFAKVSGDHQFIHVDPERAQSETPFGGTIAHGFLTLSLISQLCAQFAVPLAGTVMAINYGLDRVRFLTPVKTGSLIRARSRLVEVSLRQAGQVLTKARITVEIKDEKKPALIADWLTMTVVDS
jgi:acyl dehydratase